MKGDFFLKLLRTDIGGQFSYSTTFLELQEAIIFIPEK